MFLIINNGCTANSTEKSGLAITRDVGIVIWLVGHNSCYKKKKKNYLDWIRLEKSKFVLVGENI